MNQENSHHLGFWSMVLLGINGIIGSGIFLLPGRVMHLTGHWSLVVYALVTCVVLSIAWCFAKCATLYQRNGGAYVYAKEAFGDFIGFEIGIMRWAVGILAWAAILVGFVTALSTIWPDSLKEPMRSLLIIGLVAILGVFNIIGIKIFKYVNNFVTVAKLLPLVLFIVLGAISIQGTNYSPLNLQEFETDAFGSAALIVFYAFGGFETLVVAAEEMKNPRKNLPLAVMLVMAFCSLLYFSIHFIAIGLLGDKLAESVAPLSDAAHLLLGDSGRWFVTIAMLISVGGINLTASFVTPRSGVALAEDGMIPRKIASKGRFGTPVWAILLTIGLTGFCALSGSFTQLAIISVVSRFAQYISTCLAVYVLSKKMEKAKSFYQRILLIVIPAFGLIGIAWLLWQATFVQIAYGLGALVIGIPLYWIQGKDQSTEEVSAMDS